MKEEKRLIAIKNLLKELVKVREQQNKILAIIWEMVK